MKEEGGGSVANGEREHEVSLDDFQPHVGLNEIDERGLSLRQPRHRLANLT